MTCVNEIFVKTESLLAVQLSLTMPSGDLEGALGVQTSLIEPSGPLEGSVENERLSPSRLGL